MNSEEMRAALAQKQKVIDVGIQLGAEGLVREVELRQENARLRAELDERTRERDIAERAVKLFASKEDQFRERLSAAQEALRHAIKLVTQHPAGFGDNYHCIISFFAVNKWKEALSATQARDETR